MRSAAILGAGLLATALVPAALQAQTTPRETIIAQLDAVANVTKANGYRPDPSAIDLDAVVGLLPPKGGVILEVKLETGGAYLISAGCDSDCDDLDLRLISEEGETIAEDVETDDVPVLEFVAPHTGRFMLSVMMPGCSAELCYFGYRVHRSK